ncbi:MAG TPA: caspase family protein [Amycolatopsis sp.]|uniref:caspase, EACC1-associated type n=1 Tax=Amycolatopsis sp. TaxID=37632 RepID=UPI002B45AD47|nr:caspase family protein [Amycolatopsis sp.]HKS47452.1 caspase family protein [Amycolatopsis sp.]
MSAIDFSRSRAILVGTAHYTHGLTEMIAASNSLNTMRKLLIGPLCGWPDSRVTLVEDKTTRGGLDQHIAQLIHDTTDVLLFYYVGHGQLLDGEHLGMALKDTHADPKMRYVTSLRLNDVRAELERRCTARVKLVILDCCFSGLATRNAQGTGLTDQVQLATKVEGAYTLTASRASQQAIYEDGSAGLTYFTKVFTDVVHDGIPGAGTELTLKDIHKEVRHRFLRLEVPGGQLRPEPSVLVTDTAEELAFARNAAATKGDQHGQRVRPPEPPKPPRDIELGRPTRPAPVDQPKPLANAGSTLVEAADQLAHAVGTRWRREEEQRQVRDPFPLPVRWQPAPENVTDHWENIRGAPAGGNCGPLDLAGRLDQIVDVYLGIESGRLVVLGRAGSGKTILTIRLALDLLKNRTSTSAVPVIFSLGSWNPETALEDWLTSQLVRDHPGLAATNPNGVTLAAALVGAGGILPILDGFDEIADGLHPRALEELNRTSLRLLLTSRRAEYEAAVQGKRGLTAAAGIELADLTLTDLADYLPRTTRKVAANGTATVWEPVLNELRDHPRSPGNVNLATVLTTPLMVALARTIYSDTPDHDPSELLDTNRFGTPEALEDHLVGNFIPTIYQNLPESDRRWDPGQVQHWLAYLAHHLDQNGTPNVAWWQLGNTMRRWSRMYTVAWASGLVLGVVDGLVTGLQNWLMLGFVAGLKVGLLSGIVVGIAGGLAFGLVHEFGPGLVTRSVALEPSRVQIRIRNELRKKRARFAPRFLLGFVAGLMFGIVAWLVIGFVVWFLVEFMSWLVSGPVSALASGLVPGSNPGVNGLIGALENGLKAGLAYGVVYGLMIGLAAGIMTRLEVPIDIRSVVSPAGLLKTNRTSTLVQLLVWGLVANLVGGLAGALWFRLGDGLVIGLVGGLGGGLGYGLSLTAWGQWVVLARIWLPLTGRMPWTVIAFLDDAYRRGVLRQAGAVYQFRHARLQDHLTRAFPARRDEQPASSR